MKENETFQYTYSAKQQDEINAIREKYVPKAPPTDREQKLERLRKLDAAADRAGNIAAIAVGLVGMTLFAFGMCCVTAWAERFFALGVVIGVLGLGCMGGALPLYRLVAARKREQLAPEVLRLAEELENNE